jgi:glycosyltransferase involved in cell wall biosynthesis
MLEKKLTLSIVIPAYNEERYIVKCLDAIAAQTVMPDDVIVVDNNSTDRTAEIAKKYPFVKLLNEPRQGIAYARNLGFDAAGSEIIGRIDADTVLPPTWVEHVEEFFSKPGRGQSVLTGSCRFYNLHTGRLTARFYSLLVYRTNRILLGYYFPWGSNSALPHKLWQAVRGEVCDRPDIHEDLDLGIHLVRLGYQTTYLPGLRVGAVAKRVVTDRGELWRWLTMWPRTVRLHGIKTWPLIWPLILAVWLGRYWIFATEKFAGLF